MAIVAIVGLALWLGSSALVTWRLTRRVAAPFPEPPPEIAGAKVEACRLTTADAQDLGAWLVRGEGRKGCVLLLHGNGESRHQMLPLMRRLADARFSMLAVTLRAHGDSTGEVNDLGWSARHDVVAGVNLLRQECPGEPVYVVGCSLGAAAAIFAAGELKEDVAGYFLEQPYKDLSSALRNRLELYLPPVLDRVAYSGMRLWAPLLLPVAPDRISPYEHMTDIPASVPVMLLAGTADRHARPQDVVDLFGQVQSHARLVVFPGAGHGGLDTNNPQLYWKSLFELLEHRPSKSPARLDGESARGIPSG